MGFSFVCTTFKYYILELCLVWTHDCIMKKKKKKKRMKKTSQVHNLIFAKRVQPKTCTVRSILYVQCVSLVFSQFRFDIL